MTQKKMTKREMFNALLDKYNFDENEIAFIEHELELLDRKSASDGERKPSAKQIENEGYKALILNFMTADKQYTITDLIKGISEFNNFNNQKVTALVRQMYADVKKGESAEDFPIIRSEIKGKALFSLNPTYKN
jgi:hypothetical protein